MTSYNFGDVILVPFPFTNQTTTKKRPAVVISSYTYNQEHPDLIVMAITSQNRQILMFGDVTITNWREAGLLKPSSIKAIVTTVEETWTTPSLRYQCTKRTISKNYRLVQRDGHSYAGTSTCSFPAKPNAW